MALPQMTAGAQDSAWFFGICVAASGPHGSSVLSRFLVEPLEKHRRHRIQSLDVRCGHPVLPLVQAMSPTVFGRMALKPLWHSINQFNVLGGNWDPADKKFNSVNTYRQDLLPTCKTSPKETTTCIWVTQSHKVCNGATVLQEA